ncbi:MAG TPA: hypothetical protein VF251_11985 [Pyrinomonadaceae bacterium]
MYKTISVLLTLFALFGSAVAQANEWQRLAPTGAGYAVMIPGKAEEQAINQDQYRATLYTLTVKDGGSPRVIYLAGVGDYAATVKVDPQTELPADRDNFIKGLPGMKLLESHNITLDGRPGIELTGESDQVTVTARFYIKGNRVYQVAALVFKGMDEKENVSKFFESFAFLD